MAKPLLVQRTKERNIIGGKREVGGPGFEQKSIGGK